MTPKVFVRFVLSLLAMMLVVTDADAQSSVVDSVRSLFEVDDSASATALARAAVQTRPQDADSHCAMAVVYDMAEEQESAVESAERCVELEPNSSDNQYILADASMELAGQKGGLGALGPARRGKAAAEKAIELDPDNLNARILLFFFHMQAPGIAGGSKKEAERQTVEISKRDPAMGVYTRYRLRLDKADDDELAALFKAALPQCGPTDSLSYAIATATGTAVRVEDDALAEELVGKLYAAQAEDPRAQYYRARLWAMQGRNLEQAEQLLLGYAKLTEPPPFGASIAGARWRLGLVYEKQERKQEALEQYQLAAELAPDWEEPRQDVERLKKELGQS
jgi:tetratricopeptide (TPR) repeat protein